MRLCGRWQYCEVPFFRVSRRWRPVAALVPAVLALHALVLGLLPLGVGRGWPADAPPRSVQLRQLPLNAPAALAPVVPAVPATPVTSAAPAPAPLPRVAPPAAAPAALSPVVAAVEGAPASAPAAAEPPAAVASEAQPAPVAAVADAPASAASAAAPAEGGPKPPPVYATRFPPPAELAYDLRRGALGGSGEIRWQPAAGRYTMELHGSAFGLPVLNWRSEGGLDGAGLAPERFLDQRRGGRSNAANFQRAAGKITYSGPGVEFPLVPGAQDRLSWTVQLAAIVAAEPARFTAGEPISMFVTGARGDGDVWTFEVQGRERLDLPAGEVPEALKLRRQPRRPYDTLVEVWLDPARAWLPVRMRWIVVQTDETTEFRLTGVELR